MSLPKQERNIVPLQVLLNDPDGSESFVLEIVDDLPEGTILFGEDNRTIPAEDGVYTLTPEDVAALEILPPLHYSSIVSGNINLRTTTIVTDGDDTISFDLTISVDIVGVADKPPSRTVSVVAQEDSPYILGGAINRTGVLIDVSNIVHVKCKFSLATC